MSVLEKIHAVLAGNIPFAQQGWMLLAAVVYLAIVFWMLKTKKFNVRYSLIWLLCGGVMVLFAAVPYFLLVLRDLLDIQMPSNLVFLLAIGFIMLLLLSITAAVTNFSERIKRLTQSQAILEKRVRELEEELARRS